MSYTLADLGSLVTKPTGIDERQYYWGSCPQCCHKIYYHQRYTDPGDLYWARCIGEDEATAACRCMFMLDNGEDA